MNSKRFSLSLSFVLSLGFQVAPVQACGPEFPNNLLSGGDAAVLIAPQASFARELVRMKLVPSRFQASETTNSFATEATIAELADLASALKKSELASPQCAELQTNLAVLRARLETFIEGMNASENSRSWTYDEQGRRLSEASIAPPEFPTFMIPEHLPAEFADYLEGALAWHNPALPDKGLARQAWQRLLDRPPAERRYKSTWAAFMLGKSLEQDDPASAIRYFQQVRELAQKGFKDSLGLAAASLGLEAHVELRQKHFEKAISLYLDQLATGDSSSTNSLRVAAGEALAAGPVKLRSLAKNPRTQRIITAYVISQPLDELGSDSETSENSNSSRTIRNWLAAVEAAEVRDVESAEELALAAYRANEMDLATRWLKRAPQSPVAQWLQAKLLLRAGKLNEAAAILAKVAQTFPVAPLQTNDVPPLALKDTLYIVNWGAWLNRMPIERQVLGELGVLRLTRREYVQALDALLNAGFWMDAAYVAERVLNLDELKDYVDAHWPTVSAAQAAEEEQKYPLDELCPAKLRSQIRYLLARRLTRAFRSGEARAYYPSQCLEQFDELVRALNVGWDETQPRDSRASAFFEAAVLTRTNGMELIGTEVAPDWHIHDGTFDDGVTAEDRATNENAAVVVASADELQRNEAHHADPELRFHYRYQAAALAWEAAKLMPNNSDDTARVLYTAGSWLKYRDPHTADLFYKALVRRNRKTALGAEADRERWFPQLDSNGNVVIRTPAKIQTELVTPDEPASSPDDANKGAETAEALMTDGADSQEHDAASDESGKHYVYTVQKGDSLAAIVQALAALGSDASIADILHANPRLDPAKLLVGQKLLIPLQLESAADPNAELKPPSP